MDRRRGKKLWGSSMGPEIPDPDAVGFNPADMGTGITLSEGNFLATRNSGVAAAYRQAHGVTQHGTGKWYYELEVVRIVTLVGMGLGATGDVLTHFLGSGTFCMGVYTGGHYEPGTIANYVGSGAMSVGDIVSVAVDMDTDKFWMRKNGGAWSGAVVGAGDPATGAGGKSINTGMIGASNIVISVVMHNGGSGGDSVRLNSGNAPWAYTPPTGFSPWG